MESAHIADRGGYYRYGVFPVLGRKQTTLSQGELLDRIKKVIVMATDFVLFTGKLELMTVDLEKS